MTITARVSMWVLGGFLIAAIGARGETTIETDEHPSRGPVEATVTIVEFADFECKQCRDMYLTLKTVQENYPDQVRLVFRQLPLNTIHSHAQRAAEASLCAFEQGGFWEYHDALFGNADDLTMDSLNYWAGIIGLDVERFGDCLAGGAKAAAVRRDIEDAIARGAYSTPTLYINEQMLTGNWPYREVARMIEAELFRQLEEDLDPPLLEDVLEGAEDGDPGPLLHDRPILQSP